MNIPSSNRASKIESLAFSLKMNFIDEEDYGMVRQLKDFKLFKKGQNKRIYNLMHLEEANRSFFLFDYEYTVRRNKRRKKRNQTVLFINSKELGLPEFGMKPENLADKFVQWIGFEDIDFESHPKFSKNYKLTGEEEALIRYYFTTDVLDFLSLESQWHIEGINYYLVIYSLHERFHTDMLQAFLRFGKHLHKLFAKNTFDLS